jgi:hypothetical protein
MTDSSNINGGSYAQYDFFDEYSYTLIKYLMENDEVIWKLLKYDTPDAWNRADLSQVEKGSLIYAGGDNSATARVFMDIGQPDVLTEEVCIVRISPYSIFPDNRVVGTTSIMFEVYSHYKINHLSNYKTRIDMITKRLIQVFNGSLIGGLGRLFFDRVGSDSNRMENGSQLPFKGRWIIMSNKAV